MKILYVCQAVLGTLILSGLLHNRLWSVAVFYTLRTVLVFTLAIKAGPDAEARRGTTKGATAVLAAGIFSDAVLILLDSQLGKSH